MARLFGVVKMFIAIDHKTRVVSICGMHSAPRHAMTSLGITMKATPCPSPHQSLLNVLRPEEVSHHLLLLRLSLSLSL